MIAMLTPTTVDLSNQITWLLLVLGVAAVLGGAFSFINWIEDTLATMADEDTPEPNSRCVVLPFQPRRIR